MFSAFTTEGYPFTNFNVIPTILEVCVVEKGSHIFSAITIKTKIERVEIQRKLNQMSSSPQLISANPDFSFPLLSISFSLLCPINCGSAEQ